MWHTDQQIADAYKTVGGEKRTADLLGITRATVYNALRRTGVKTKPLSEKDKLILQMYHDGHARREIAAALGCNANYVTRILSFNGIRAKKAKKRDDGRYLDKQGYLWMHLPPNDPMACMLTRKGIVAEHRLVMARKLNRPLFPKEHVHHINGVRTDNRPENLQLMQGNHGKGIAMCCLDCGSRNVAPYLIEAKR